MNKQLAKSIDKLGVLDAKIAGLEDLKKQADALRGEIRLAYSSKQPDKAYSEDGLKYTATIGVAGNERKIREMSKVFAAVGSAIFFEDCGYPLKKLEDRLVPEVVATLVTTARTGTRPVKTFERTAK